MSLPTIDAAWLVTLSNALHERHKIHLDWWLAAAVRCIASNRCHLITSRDGTMMVYMLRCWLSHPKPPAPGVSSPYESGNATLLHWILQPDDIPHLHNHPWKFRTHILSGGYVEHRDGSSPHHERIYRPGDDSFADLGTFHRIASHLDGPGDPTTGQGGTWSLVTTSGRVQPWSFLIDGCERDAETYLRNKSS